jgi:hypothetical protein
MVQWHMRLRAGLYLYNLRKRHGTAGAAREGITGISKGRKYVSFSFEE